MKSMSTRRVAITLLLVLVGMLTIVGGTALRERFARDAWKAIRTQASVEAKIYADVIRRLYLVDGFSSPKFDRIFVRSWVGSNMTNPGSPEHRSIDLEVQRLVEARLADLPPIEFVDDFESVVDPGFGSVVRDNGVLVRLGEIKPVRSKVHISADLYHSGTGAHARVYVLTVKVGKWQIVGDTGQRWIASPAL